MRTIDFGKVKRIAIGFSILFVVTFCLRTVYDIFFTGKDVIVSYNPQRYNNSVEYEDDLKLRESINVASESLKKQDLSGQNITIDQKYEKTANITTTTSEFSKENQQIREMIQEHSAVVQKEYASGLEGVRVLEMTIGVFPEKFDIFVEQIQKVGKVVSFEVNKTDKTNEYRELMAQLETLKKTIDSYTEMKEKGGTIQDMMLVENKILEIHEKMQELGVNLGIYSDENSFCTVNIFMNEVARTSTVADISLRFVFSCIRNAFFWTTTFYSVLIFLVIMLLVGILIILKIIENIQSHMFWQNNRLTEEKEASEDQESHPSSNDKN